MKSNKNIHVLPTDKPSRLIIQNGNKLILGNEEYSIIENRQHIYITSDEKIKEGDYCIDGDDIYGPFVEGDIATVKFIKIILTTDAQLIRYGVQAIDGEFLEWFVKNPSCEYVEVSEDYFKPSNMVYGHDMEPYKIIIPKEEPKLSNICIKCGVDLYATEGKFICQKHPKECKGIYLSEETLLTHAAEQKQHLIDMMKSDEELRLYDEPKQETLQEAAERLNYFVLNGRTPFNNGFKEGAKWQQERGYSEEEVEFIKTLIDFYWSNYNNEHPNNLKDFELSKSILETFKNK